MGRLAELRKALPRPQVFVFVVFPLFGFVFLHPPHIILPIPAQLINKRQGGAGREERRRENSGEEIAQGEGD